jgi:hypothetical protein
MLQIGRSAKLTPQVGTMALLLYTVQVRLRNLLDLTDVAVQQTLGTTPAELASPWRHRRSNKQAPTQLLGAAIAKSALFDGIRFQSTKGPGACVVVFASLVKSPGYVRVLDSKSKLVGRLP